MNHDALPSIPMEWHGYSWLDKIIEEQAAYYGMSVEKHGKLMNDVAQYLEDNPQL